MKAGNSNTVKVGRKTCIQWVWNGLECLSIGIWPVCTTSSLLYSLLLFFSAATMHEHGNTRFIQNVSKYVFLQCADPRNGNSGDGRSWSQHYQKGHLRIVRHASGVAELQQMDLRRVGIGHRSCWMWSVSALGWQHDGTCITGVYNMQFATVTICGMYEHDNVI